MEIISVRAEPSCAEAAIGYFQKRWGAAVTNAVYSDCISHSLTTSRPLPNWYLLLNCGEIVGGAGLITNDFISRMDLWPWLCALYVEEDFRHQGNAGRLIERIKSDCAELGFDSLYLCTDHIGFYERYGFEYIGDGYHPWGETSRIYEAPTRSEVREILRLRAG